jgi:tetratricopeptide (TPR) repeat protein
LALAYLYIGYELRAEAIETLEALVKEGSQTAAVYRTLGALYEEVGLSRLALTRYLKTAELAAAAKDVEEQAVATVGLGNAYEAIGNVEAARRWLTQARDGYATLGDTERVSELEGQLAKLNS